MQVNELNDTGYHPDNGMQKLNREALLSERDKQANRPEKRRSWQEYQIRPDMRLLIQNTNSEESPLQYEHRDGKTPLQFLYCLSGKAEICTQYKNGSRTYIDLSRKQYSMSYVPESYNTHITQIRSPLKLIAFLVNPESFWKLYHEIEKICKRIDSNAQKNTRKECSYELKKCAKQYTFCHQSILSFHTKIILDQILNCPKYGNELKKIFIEYKAMELLYNQISTFCSSDIEKYKKISSFEIKAAHDAYDLLMHDFTSPPCLTALSKRVGLSRNRLNEVFKILHNDTVFGIFRNKRLECAKKMLENGQKNVAEIAYECGFSTPSHFSRCFFDKYGVQPKRYQSSIVTTY